jgi:hypothetical protein
MELTQTFSSITPLQRLCALSQIVEEGGPKGERDLVARFSPLGGTRVNAVSETITSSPLAQKILSLISTMRALDWAFERDLNYKRHVYVLGDETIAALPGFDAGEDGVAPRDILELMGTIGLIYRFNVAPKFGISNPGTMQLRLNGWGRDVFEAFGCADKAPYKTALEYISTCISENRALFTELLALCNSDERPLAVERIATLIDRAPIKVVT